MASTPARSQGFSDRLLQMLKTLQFAWFAGHVVLLLSSLRYSISFLTFSRSTMTRLSYRSAFFSAAVTYGIVVFKAYKSRTRSGRQVRVGDMIWDENVQYFILAFVWLFSRQIGIATLPYIVYSVFHVATYVRSTLLPTLYPQQSAETDGSVKTKQSALADAIGNFIKSYYDPSMMLVALMEIVVWLRLLVGVLFFSKGAFVLFIIYSFFLRNRYVNSPFVQNASMQLVARMDTVFASQSTPPALRQAWDISKQTVRNLLELTGTKVVRAERPNQSSNMRTR